MDCVIGHRNPYFSDLGDNAYRQNVFSPTLLVKPLRRPKVGSRLWPFYLIHSHSRRQKRQGRSISQSCFTHLGSVSRTADELLADTERIRNKRTKDSVRMSAEILGDGTVRFRLWAPAAQTIGLEIRGVPEILKMTVAPEGWHELIADQASAGDRYRFVLPNGLRVADPASRFQPEDVHGPSEIIDTAGWVWNDIGWKGRHWHEAVIYELHIGTFTPEGTFLAAIDKLDHLTSVGITAIELMPIGDFPGHRNWGYDGVLPYAPDSSYGWPEDLKALVEAAHARGLMVLLDVVYNHFGPDGNYLHAYAPQFFTERHKTPWGAAINFDGEHSRQVRDFFISNAIYWLEQFHFDGLRIDAAHAIADESSTHILAEISERVRAAINDRQIHLVLENDRNQSQWLERLYTAQWNDDAHHALHTALTGECQGYYAEYSGDTAKLGRALAEGFAFQGEVMTYLGEPRGEVSRHLRPSAFIAFLQNHDQIGNRAFGDRLVHTARPAALRAAAAVYLLLPQIPMLFMGEEWAATQPFPFFCDFGPEVADAVRRGRREEFSRFPQFQDPAQREKIPDPQAAQTFLSAKLHWEERDEPSSRKWLDWYSRILARRHQAIVPLIPHIHHGGKFQVLGSGAVQVRWPSDEFGVLVLAANLSGKTARGFESPRTTPIWSEGRMRGGELDAWSAVWWLEE